MRAVVIGGSGQIGSWLLRTLAERGHEAVGTYATVPFDGLVPLDASHLAESAEWLRAQNPDVVFYPAGFTWVDGCERDPNRARSANVEQPLNLARAAAEVGARFVSFSTDYVFDGAAGPYAETDPPNPLSVYGRAKLEGEQALGDACLNLRTTWVYGPERQGKNFAYQLARALREKGELLCPSDQFSTPSYGPDVALAAVLLAERGEAGIVHVAGPDFMGRVEFARALATAFGLDPAGIIGRPTAELGQGAPRPLRGGLRTARLDARLPDFRMKPLAACLADFQARLTGPGGSIRPLFPG